MNFYSCRQDSYCSIDNREIKMLLCHAATDLSNRCSSFEYDCMSKKTYEILIQKDLYETGFISIKYKGLLTSDIEDMMKQFKTYGCRESVEKLLLYKNYKIKLGFLRDKEYYYKGDY